MVTIRPATPDDVPALHRLIVGLSDHHDHYGVSGTGVTRERLLRWGFGSNRLFEAHLAEIEIASDPVGYMILERCWSGRTGLPKLEITHLFSLPEIRGRGVGKALVLRAREIAAEIGAVRLTLDVDPRNEATIAFYKAMGFADDTRGTIGMQITL